MRTIIIQIIFLPLTLVQVVFAQTPNFGWLVDLFDDISDVIDKLIPILIALAFLVFVWGLIVFIMQSGDERAVAEGRRKMVWGVLALFVIVSIWGIISLLQGWIGADSDIGIITAPGVPD